MDSQGSYSTNVFISFGDPPYVVCLPLWCVKEKLHQTSKTGKKRYIQDNFNKRERDYCNQRENLNSGLLKQKAEESLNAGMG